MPRPFVRREVFSALFTPSTSESASSSHMAHITLSSIHKKTYVLPFSKIIPLPRNNDTFLYNFIFCCRIRFTFSWRSKFSWCRRFRCYQNITISNFYSTKTWLGSDSHLAVKLLYFFMSEFLKKILLVSKFDLSGKEFFNWGMW